MMVGVKGRKKGDELNVRVDEEERVYLVFCNPQHHQSNLWNLPFSILMSQC